jgi:beta-N-acetylhexosaminidase
VTLRDLRRHAGQLVAVGFAGPVVPPEIRALVREFDLGGVVLFGRNCVEPAQVAELAYELRRLGPEQPLWVAVDQEGGRVARLKRPFTEWPPMAALGRAGDEGLARRFAAALAAELRAVGISLDLAPVLDVPTDPRNTVIGDRALGDAPDIVARLGRAIVQELQSGGVAACAKHFPGHGATSADSHEELPVIDLPPERFRAVEFVPFRAAIEAGVTAIMVGHLLVPAFDEAHPASLSPAIVGKLLRDELGFGGLVVTDDLEMKAVSGREAVERAAVKALAAGCDLLLVCGTDHDRQVAVLEAIIHALEENVVPRTQVEEALARHAEAKARVMAGAPARPPSARTLAAVVGAAEHAAIADEMAVFA